MAVRFLRHRWHKITLVASAVIVSVLLIFSILVNRYWSPVLADTIKDAVLKSSDSLYNVDFSDAELHVLRGSITFYNITIKPDTFVYNRKKRQHLAPNNLFEVSIKRLTLAHIHPFTLYFDKKLDIGEIIVKQPELKVSYQLNHTKDTIIKDRQTAWQKISKKLRSVHVGNILLGNVKFRYDDYSGNKLEVSELKELNLSAHDLLIDSATQFDKSRLLYFKDIDAELNNYTGKTASGLYTYTINSLKLSTLKSQLDIQGINLKPIAFNTFFEKSHSDRFTVHLDSLRLNNFDFLSYHKYRTLTGTNLDISNGSIDIFNNPNKSADRSDRIRTFPNVGLKKIYADLKIDTINLHHINIYYNEYNNKSKKTGTISFNNTSGKFLNVVTNDTALKKNNICNIMLTSYFMNRGKLNLTFNFNLTDSKNSFDYKGILNPMDLQSINPATMPLAMVKISSGKLKELKFDIKADKNNARGRVTLLYNDLKVALLKSDSVSENLKHRTFASMFANLFILKHDNPDVEGKTPRSFYVNYARTPETPFFKSLWQTLLSGLKPAIGLDEKTQKATAELVNQMAQAKKDHAAKKQLRMQRREERRRKKEEKKQQQPN